MSEMNEYTPELFELIDEEGNKDGQYISALNDYKLSDLQTAESGSA